jgi:hypothetical protein
MNLTKAPEQPSPIAYLRLGDAAALVQCVRPPPAPIVKNPHGKKARKMLATVQP